ncbi:MULTISPECIES: chaperone modulator CbpM [Sphingobacterium]|uniref:MerR family transcriptional regulator n=2 Tax=Sphingobacterium TaxID=28453 RepID=U2HG56_9SPHI|nr:MULTISPECIES: chaperone modulator CbpM [Sphingobacterium]ERJ60741.1 hypothetical protein M472_18445 [Sphingobacterium paucimobilis HER1398]MBL1407906.1 hypothetical protein [Sphingobacterium faecale]
MEATLFKIVDICRSNNIEIAFIKELHQNGLIEITVIESQEFVHEDQVAQIQKYQNWYYDLELNIQGIEIVQQLLHKIESLKSQIQTLKRLH